MGSLRRRLPQVSVHRSWSPDGEPIWHFQFTSRWAVEQYSGQDGVPGETNGSTRMADPVPPAPAKTPKAKNKTAETPEPEKPPRPEPVRPERANRWQPPGRPYAQPQPPTFSVRDPTQNPFLPDPLAQSPIGRTRLVPDPPPPGSRLPAQSPRMAGSAQRSIPIGDGNLQIEEYCYRVEKPNIDFSEPLANPDIASALVKLAAHPEGDTLRHRVVGRLAILNGWFRNAADLDVYLARVAGRGMAGLVDGVFIWRGQGGPESFVYLVVPDARSRDLFLQDAELTRALVQVACPRPGDFKGSQLERRLKEASLRQEPGLRPDVSLRPEVSLGSGPDRGAQFPDAGAVLEIKNIGAATVGPQDIQLINENVQVDRLRTASTDSDDHATDSATRAKRTPESALSAELADLARKVGVHSTRPTPAANGHVIEGSLVEGTLIDGTEGGTDA